jgi:hypothetical protein
MNQYTGIAQFPPPHFHGSVVVWGGGMLVKLTVSAIPPAVFPSHRSRGFGLRSLALKPERWRSRALQIGFSRQRTLYDSYAQDPHADARVHCRSLPGLYAIRRRRLCDQYSRYMLEPSCWHHVCSTLQGPLEDSSVRLPFIARITSDLEASGWILAHRAPPRKSAFGCAAYVHKCGMLSPRGSLSNI